MSASKVKMDWPSGHRVVAHIDMDAFFASVEVLDDPSLAGKPVIVGGSSKRGVVSAASYEARNFGVHSAMPLFRARKLCPGGVFLPVRIRRYAEVSRVVMGCLREFSPLVEQVSVDEAYVELTGTEKLFGAPHEAAAQIKGRMREKTSLICSIGVSICKLVAKIASDVNKPDGITVVPPAGVEAFLSALPIGRIPGIGGKTGERLKRAGIVTVGDMKRYPPDWFHRRFGKFGARLLDIAEGRNDSPVLPFSAPKSISAEETLESDTADRKIIEKHLLAQSERVAGGLRKKGYAGRTITLKLKHDDFRTVTRSVSLERPTQLAKVIYGEAAKLLSSYELRSAVRLVGVGVSRLEPAGGGGQMSLFRDDDESGERWERAERAVDRIVERFGKGAIKRGRLLE